MIFWTRELSLPSPWGSVYAWRLAEVTPLPQSQGLDERRETGGQLPSTGAAEEKPAHRRFKLRFRGRSCLFRQLRLCGVGWNGAGDPGGLPDRDEGGPGPVGPSREECFDRTAESLRCRYRRFQVSQASALGFRWGSRSKKNHELSCCPRGASSVNEVPHG